MSLKQRHCVPMIVVASCMLTLVSGCTPVGVLDYLSGCEEQNNAATGGISGSVIASGVRDGMTIRDAQAWYDGLDGPGDVCAAYPDGQCTWWACMRGHKLGLNIGSHWGNGGDWAASARAAGWKTTRTSPVPGSLVSYPPGVAGASTLYGHVAVVEAVDTAAGTVTISEMNASGGPGIVNSRTHRIDVGAVYILPDNPVHDTENDSTTNQNLDTSSPSESTTVTAAWVCPAKNNGTSTDVNVDYKGDGTHATPSQAQAIAKQMIAAYKDWTDEDYQALVWLWNHESGWQWDATNPSSGAYGIPQALPASKLATAGDDWKDNAATQITWGLNYIAERYGSPTQAKRFWLANNWY